MSVLPDPTDYAGPISLPQAVALSCVAVHHGASRIGRVQPEVDGRMIVAAADGEHARWVTADGTETPAPWCRDCGIDLHPDEITHDMCPFCGGKPRYPNGDAT